MTDNKLAWLKDTLDQIYDTAKRKNADYCVGEKWSDNFEEFGLYGMLARWGDKVKRVKRLLLGNHERAVADETVEDTLMDLATYSLLIMQAHREGMAMYGEADFYGPGNLSMPDRRSILEGVAPIPDNYADLACEKCGRSFRIRPWPSSRPDADKIELGDATCICGGQARVYYHGRLVE